MKFKYKTTKEFLTKPRTKKQYANMLRVLYGKKKDRGHYKAAYFRLKIQEKEALDTMFEYMSGKCEKLNPIMNFLKSTYSMFF